MALQAGDMIRAYQTAGQFGQGGMATIYKAYHPHLERRVAVKFLHQSYSANRPYIIDFGPARMTLASQFTLGQDKLMDTPYYISSEQAKSEDELGSTFTEALESTLSNLVNKPLPTWKFSTTSDKPIPSYTVGASGSLELTSEDINTRELE